MLGQLDGEILSPRAGVPADDAVAIEQAHLGVGGDEREDAVGGVVADGVAVAVEADEGGLVRGGARHEVGRDGGAREREQPLLLLGEDLRDGPVLVRRVLPRHRDGFQEVPERGVAALQRGDHARREEARLEEADGPLDAALVGRRADARGPKRDVKERGELDGSSWKRMARPTRAATMLLGLSKSHSRVTPPKYCAARASERTRLTVVCSSTSSAHIARE